MSGRSRREYLAVIYSRYRRAGLQEKQVILDEFCRNGGYNRKYAIRLLNGPAPHRRREPPPRRHRSPSYSKGVTAALAAAREAPSHPCAARLNASLRLWMPWLRARRRLRAAIAR